MTPQDARLLHAAQRLGLPVLPFKPLPHFVGFPEPAPGIPLGRGSARAAGIDLFACQDEASGPIQMYPGRKVLVPTGLTVEIPIGYCLMVVSRSGMALKKGLVVFNTPGIIDSDYRGEIMVMLTMQGEARPCLVERGERIAQMLLMPVANAVLMQVEELSATERGAGGFGSTGER